MSTRVFLEDSPQIHPTVKDAENLHVARHDAVENDVRVNERAAEVRGNLRAKSADFWEAGQGLALLRELGCVAVGGRRTSLFEIGENRSQVRFRLG